MKKIIFFITIFLCFFIPNVVHGAIFESKLDQYSFSGGTDSQQLENYVPRSFEFNYQNWLNGQVTRIKTGNPSSYLYAYPIFIKNTKDEAYNFKSIAPMAVFVNPFYDNGSNQEVEIPIMVDRHSSNPIMAKLFWKVDENEQQCLYISFYKKENKLTNACFSRSKQIEPFILFLNVQTKANVEYSHYFNLTFHYKEELLQNSSVTIEYTLTRKSGCSGENCVHPISLYKPQNITFFKKDLEGENRRLGGFRPLGGKSESSVNETSVDSTGTKEIVTYLYDHKYKFKLVNSQRAFRFYSYNFENYPAQNLPFDSFEEYSKIYRYHFLPINDFDFLEHFAPAFLREVYGNPVNQPKFETANEIDGISGGINLSPVPPNCEFGLMSGVPCAIEWIGYHFNNLTYNLGNFFKNFVDSIKSIPDKILKFIEEKLNFSIPKISFSGYTDTCGNEYTKNNGNVSATIEENNQKDLSFIQNIANVISIAVPFAPANNSKICTFYGEKTVHYAQNTKFFDTIFVMIAFSSIIFTLISSNKND